MTRPLVLFFTPFFGKPPPAAELPDDAEWTNDRRRFGEARIVVFHIPDWRRGRRLPFKRRGQLFVAWSMESAVNYSALDDRAFMARFDIEMTYRQSADVWVPYLPRRAAWEAAQAAPVPDKTEAAPLAMFVSAEAPHSNRKAYAAALMEHLPVDSYGRLLRNRALPVPDTGREARLGVLKRYRFVVAFENSVAPDYVTEKLYEPLLAGAVPVYRGAPNVADLAPEGSFIDASGFADPRVLAAYLNRLAATPEAYARFFAWRQRPLPARLLDRLARIETPAFARLVEVATRPAKGPAPGLWRRLLDHAGLSRPR